MAEVNKKGRVLDYDEITEGESENSANLLAIMRLMAEFDKNDDDGVVIIGRTRNPGKGENEGRSAAGIFGTPGALIKAIVMAMEEDPQLERLFMGALMAHKVYKSCK